MPPGAGSPGTGGHEDRDPEDAGPGAGRGPRAGRDAGATRGPVAGRSAVEGRGVAAGWGPDDGVVVFGGPEDKNQLY